MAVYKGTGGRKTMRKMRKTRMRGGMNMEPKVPMGGRRKTRGRKTRGRK